MGTLEEIGEDVKALVKGQVTIRTTLEQAVLPRLDRTVSKSTCEATSDALNRRLDDHLTVIKAEIANGNNHSGLKAWEKIAAGLLAVVVVALQIIGHLVGK